MVYNNILDTIGHTPVVRINRLNRNKRVTIYAKLEGANPGGSVKDRIALAMISAAEESGELKSGKIIIEATSGNTGIGLALAAAVKGYKVVLVMSAGMSPERKKILKAFGADLIETDREKGTDGAIIRAEEIYRADPEKYWQPNQFNNPNNPQAHYLNTASEIIAQIPEIDIFVAGIGTSGTLMGVSDKLKEYNRKIKIIGVEPQPGHKIAGLKNLGEAIVPGIFRRNKLDRIIVVYNEEAYAMARRLAREEGILAGMSSGAAMCAALKISRGLKGGKIVALLPDRGERYLSAGLFSD